MTRCQAGRKTKLQADLHLEGVLFVGPILATNAPIQDTGLIPAGIALFLVYMSAHWKLECEKVLTNHALQSTKSPKLNSVAVTISRMRVLLTALLFPLNQSIASIAVCKRMHGWILVDRAKDWLTEKLIVTLLQTLSPPFITTTWTRKHLEMLY